MELHEEAFKALCEADRWGAKAPLYPADDAVPGAAGRASEFFRQWLPCLEYSDLAPGGGVQFVFAGGAVSAAILHGNTREARASFGDIDLFVVAPSSGAALEATRAFWKKVIRPMLLPSNYYNLSFDKYHFSYHYQLPITYNTGKTEIENIKLQVITVRYDTLGEILAGFDISPCCVLWTAFRDALGQQCRPAALADARGIFALRHRHQIVDLSRRHPSMENRILKYHERGFKMLLPFKQLPAKYTDVNTYIPRPSWGVTSTLMKIAGVRRKYYSPKSMYDSGLNGVEKDVRNGLNHRINMMVNKTRGFPISVKDALSDPTQDVQGCWLGISNSNYHEVNLLSQFEQNLNGPKRILLETQLPQLRGLKGEQFVSELRRLLLQYFDKFVSMNYFQVSAYEDPFPRVYIPPNIWMSGLYEGARLAWTQYASDRPIVWANYYSKEACMGQAPDDRDLVRCGVRMEMQAAHRAEKSLSPLVDSAATPLPLFVLSNFIGPENNLRFSYYHSCVF